MSLHVSSLSEISIAISALKRSRLKVNAHMVKCIACLLEVLSAFFAHKLLSHAASVFVDHIRLAEALDHTLVFLRIALKILCYLKLNFLVYDDIFGLSFLGVF